MEREFINPSTAHDPIPRGYSHIIKVRDAGAMLFIAGQGAVDAERNLVGEGDIQAQARQAFRNAANKLEAAGATFADVVKMVVYVTDIENHQWPVRNVRAEFIDVENPPVSTMVEVSRLAKPGNMIEIDMIAITP